MESYDELRARVAIEQVCHSGMLLQVLNSGTYQGTESRRQRLQARTLTLYRNALYWARRLNDGYTPPAEAHALAQRLDSRIK